MADPTYVRMYHGAIERKRNAAISVAEQIAEEAASLASRLRKDGNDMGEARRISTLAADLDRQVAALDALTEVSYLATDPEA